MTQTPSSQPELTGTVTIDLPAGTLGQSLLVLVAASLGLHVEETAAGIAIRRLKTVLYPFIYPQLTRSGSGSASITLGGANNGNPGSFGPASLANRNGLDGGISDAPPK